MDRLRDGMRVFDPEMARYPVAVDPVYETAATTLTGEEEESFFGSAVAGAGDVNGDGYDDVIVGSPDHNEQRGRAYISYLQFPESAHRLP